MIKKSNIPNHWEWVQFKDVVKSSLYGCNPTTGEDIEGVPYLRISDIAKDGKLKNQDLPQNAELDEKDARKYGLSWGDVAVARSGSVGQSYVYNPKHGEMVYASYLIRFTLNTDRVHPLYIKMYFQSPSYWAQVQKNTRTAAQPNLNAGEIKDFSLPLPPLEEQERIVDVLDRAFDALDHVEKLNDRVGEQADEFIETVLHSTFNPEPENERNIPEHWEFVQFDDIVESSLYGCNPTTGESVEGVPYLRISDITEDGDLKETNIPQNADVDPDDAEKYGLDEGDVVVARSGSVGQSYVYNPEHGGMVYASYLIRFTLDTKRVLPEYIKMFFQSPQYWAQVRKNSRAAAQPNLNAGEIKAFQLPLPPIQEQKRIVMKLESAKNAYTSLQSLRLENEEQLTSLKESLLHQAFQGELPELKRKKPTLAEYV